MTPKDYLRKPYTRAVIPDESGGFYAEILEFPGCYAEGETVEQAYKQLEGAAKSWIETRLAEDEEVPPPFSSLGYSGNISLRLPKTIHKRATIMAERDRVSLNTFLVTAIASRIGAEDFYNRLASKFQREFVLTAQWVRYAMMEQTQAKQIMRKSIRIQKIANTSTTSTLNW